MYLCYYHVHIRVFKTVRKIWIINEVLIICFQSLALQYRHYNKTDHILYKTIGFIVTQNVFTTLCNTVQWIYSVVIFTLCSNTLKPHSTSKVFHSLEIVFLLVNRA